MVESGEEELIGMNVRDKTFFGLLCYTLLKLTLRFLISLVIYFVIHHHIEFFHTQFFNDIHFFYRQLDFVANEILENEAKSCFAVALLYSFSENKLILKKKSQI